MTAKIQERENEGSLDSGALSAGVQLRSPERCGDVVASKMRMCPVSGVGMPGTE